jgi:alginate O-acetyltransferase complex protein AlgI
MIFVSYWFIAFIAVLFPLYWAVRDSRLRLGLLGIGCAVFHTHYAGPAGVIPIVVLGVVTYACGLLRFRWACIAGIALSVLALLFYKYTEFLSIQLLGLVAPAQAQQLYDAARPLMPALPPLGISFFVFEFVHYLFDVYRGYAPIKNPWHFGLFAIFWPSLVAGPVKRYHQFVPSVIAGVKCVSSTDVSLGLLQVGAGLVKKFAADNLTIWIDIYTPEFAALSYGWRWVYFVALAFRILLDFSGYSDMAIGYARMLGIHLPINFNWPYLARNLSDFWSRWHISLSTWIRDYIYIPLGGNRHGILRRIVNVGLAFAICGLWHGPEWHFVLWGLLHGFGLAISQNYRKAFGPPGRWIAIVFDRVPLLGWAVTFLFVGFSWLLFFYPTANAVSMMRLLVLGS